MAHAHWPSHRRSVYQAMLLDRWMRGEQYELSEELEVDSRYYGRPYAPRQETSDEYTDLSSRSTTPWAGLIVTSLAQTVYVDGVRRPKVEGNMEVWKDWQANRWDS